MAAEKERPLWKNHRGMYHRGKNHRAGATTYPLSYAVGVWSAKGIAMVTLGTLLVTRVVWP